MKQLERLQEITRILREPGGCDWDRAQDFHSIRENVIEEAYEVVDAVDRDNHQDLREELGDLLFQVVFYSRLAQEQGLFVLEDVAEGIADKLVRRHPHVFGGESPKNVDEILSRWESIKREEKGLASEAKEPASALDGVAESLPALFRAYKVQVKAARTGFDWSETGPVLAKLREETDELEAEIREFEKTSAKSDERADEDFVSAADGASAIRENERRRLEEEMGDLLFTMVNLCRHLKINPELSMNRAVDRFTERFRSMEALARDGGEEFSRLEASRKEELWERVKSDLSSGETRSA